MKKPEILWLNVVVFAATALAALVGVPYYAYTVGFDLFTILASVISLGFCGISITAGYHRLWSHKTYEAHPVIQFIFALGGAFAIQNSALHWASDHREHHKHVDNNERDPYSAGKGFWYSHIGWMLRDYKINPFTDYSNVRDLQRNKIVMWQHKYYLPLVLLTNFGIPLALGLIHGNIVGMLLTVGVLRLVVSHHSTFFINSLAHIWGKRPYTDKNTARDNGLLALLTYGEGYHNFHHIFEADYRNGIKWWHFDPTKWLIKSCSYVNLTRNLKVSPQNRIEKAVADMQLKRAQEKLAKHTNYQEQLEHLHREYDKLIKRLNEYYDAKRELLDLKRQDLKSKCAERIDEMKKQCEQLSQSWELQRKQWQSFNRQLKFS